MDKVIEILRKVLGILQVGGEWIAKIVELIGKILSWLSGMGAKGVRKVFGIKK